MYFYFVDYSERGISKRSSNWNYQQVIESSILNDFLHSNQNDTRALPYII